MSNTEKRRRHRITERTRKPKRKRRPNWHKVGLLALPSAVLATIIALESNNSNAVPTPTSPTTTSNIPLVVPTVRGGLIYIGPTPGPTMTRPVADATSVSFQQPKDAATLEYKKPFDLDYLTKLIDILQKQEESVDARTHSVQDNLMFIETSQGAATALMLDESGYYLTAGHMFGSLPGNLFMPETKHAVVYDFRTGALQKVSNFVIEPQRDVALFYAPTGKPRKPVTGLQLRLEPLSPGGKFSYLSLLATVVQSGVVGSVTQHVGSGTAKPILPEHGEPPYQGDLAIIEGAMTFAGYSGAPIIDGAGRVTGVVTGPFPFEWVDRYDQTGATVTALSEIPHVLGMGTVHTLSGE